jgi:hypothetical protein
MATETFSMRSQVLHWKVRSTKPRLPGEIRASPILCLQVAHVGRSTRENELRIAQHPEETIRASACAGLYGVRHCDNILTQRSLTPGTAPNLKLVYRALNGQSTCTILVRRLRVRPKSGFRPSRIQDAARQVRHLSLGSCEEEWSCRP